MAHREENQDWAARVPWHNQPRGPYEDYGWERGQSVLPQFRDPSVHTMPYERQRDPRSNWQGAGARDQWRPMSDDRDFNYDRSGRGFYRGQSWQGGDQGWQDSDRGWQGGYGRETGMAGGRGWQGGYGRESGMSGGRGWQSDYAPERGWSGGRDWQGSYGSDRGWQADYAPERSWSGGQGWQGGYSRESGMTGGRGWQDSDQGWQGGYGRESGMTGGRGWQGGYGREAGMSGGRGWQDSDRGWQGGYGRESGMTGSRGWQDSDQGWQGGYGREAGMAGGRGWQDSGQGWQGGYGRESGMTGSRGWQDSGQGWQGRRAQYSGAGRYDSQNGFTGSSGYGRDYGYQSDYDDRRRSGQWAGYDRQGWSSGSGGEHGAGSQFRQGYDREGMYGGRATFDQGYGRGAWSAGSQNDAGSGGFQRYNTYENQGYGVGRGQFSGRGPKGYRRSDDLIKEDVCECLTQHGQIDAGEIEIDVANGAVTLRGTVDNRQTKRLAEEVVESRFGIKEVHNQLRVRQGQQNAESRSLHGQLSMQGQDNLLDQPGSTRRGGGAQGQS